MKLIASTGTAFELKILGYEFPDLETELYDSNWLVIQVHVSHPRGVWTATHPCLLTYEVAQLADWLEQVGAGQKVRAQIYFIEPNLEFQLVNAGGKDEALRIYLGAELRPSWMESDIVCEHEVQFLTSEVDLVAAAEELRKQLQCFPQRAER